MHVAGRVPSPSPTTTPESSSSGTGAATSRWRRARRRAMTFSVDAASAPMLQELTSGCGALIAGRRLFDLTDGWGDNHPAGAPVVVVTHRPPPPDAAERFPRTTFTGSVEDTVATAKQIAGDQFVTIASADIIQQALNLGLVDELCISQVPVLFGSGISLLRRARGRPRHARGPRRGPRHPCAPPPVPGAPLTGVRRRTRHQRVVVGRAATRFEVDVATAHRTDHVSTRGQLSAGVIHECVADRRRACAPAAVRWPAPARTRSLRAFGIVLVIRGRQLGSLDDQPRRPPRGMRSDEPSVPARHRRSRGRCGCRASPP